MISKISCLNTTSLIEHKEESIPSNNKSSEIAQKTLSEMQNKAKTSLCERIVKVLKDFFQKITECFSRCFNNKDNQKVSEIQAAKKQTEATENKSVTTSANSEVKTEILDEKWNDPKFVEKAIVNIMALMLPKSELDYLKWDSRIEGSIMNPEIPFTEEEKSQRYETLKKAINEFPSQFIDLNVAIDRDKWTLLLFAIDKINDRDQRYEIAKLLREKGASIELISGLYDVKMNAILQAQERSDFRLVGWFLGIENREKLSLHSLEEARDLLLNFKHKDKENFKYLRKVIERVLPEHLNNFVEFKIGNETHRATLISLTLAKMESGSMLNWIIKDLLQKNVNLNITGTINGQNCDDYNPRLMLQRKESYIGWPSI